MDAHDHALRHNLGVTGDSVYRWSDPATWPDGQVPDSGANVTIPLGRRVLLDISPPPVRQITIAGLLEFVDGSDLALSARAIDVQGALIIGSTASRFRHQATITLMGTAGDEAAFGAGAKGIVVTGGTIELHGAAVQGWTRLGAHARAGDARLTLERETNWHAGDKIAIAATGFDPNEAEEVSIVSVEGTVVQLERPLRFSHWGQLQTIAGHNLDERAEVALLSRNIVIQGDRSSETSGFGAHVMIHPGSTAHIEGVEFFRVGQRGGMGRYPLHWHLAKDTEGHYARDNAVWHSYNRCMTIHGTNGVTLADNVCYDHQGHGYFLEDGVEHGNVLVGNLGFGTRTPPVTARLLASDERPATFWITNPDNDLRDNVAGGSEGFGIWYSLPEYPTGLSATHAIMPRHVALGRFDHNTAHSNVLSGLWVDDAVNAEGHLDIMWYEPVRDATFRRLIAWKNQALGAWFRGSRMRLVDAVLADNMVGAVFGATESSLEDSFVVGVSDNAGKNPGAWVPVSGFWFYDGPVGVARTTFANFDARAGTDASAIGFHPANPWPMSAENWVEALQFVDARRVTFRPVTESLDATKSAVIVDRDGSLTDIPASVLVPDAPLLRHDCNARRDWGAWSCTGAFAQLMVRTEVAMPVGVTLQRVNDVSSQVRVAPVRYDSAWTTLTVPLGVRLELQTPGFVPSRLSFTTSSADLVIPLDLTLPQLHADVRVEQEDRTLRKVDVLLLDGCVDCWGEAKDGGLRLRVRGSAKTHAISLRISPALAMVGARAAPFVQREPAGLASSVLKYGSRAFKAVM